MGSMATIDVNTNDPVLKVLLRSTARDRKEEAGMVRVVSHLRNENFKELNITKRSFDLSEDHMARATMAVFAEHVANDRPHEAVLLAFKQNLTSEQRKTALAAHQDRHKGLDNAEMELRSAAVEELISAHQPQKQLYPIQ